MALNDRTAFGKIEILEDGVIHLRQDRIISENGVELVRTFHRSTLEPGDNVSSRSPRIQALCAAAWTPAVIAAYEIAKTARLAALLG